MIVGWLLTLAWLPVLCQGHGYLMDPPARASLWRQGFNTPKNYNDNQLNCGGYFNQWGKNGGKCGVCGDPYEKPVPRDNEVGGMYGLGIIAHNYTAGQTARMRVMVTANHLGWFEFRLCPLPAPCTPVTQECLDKNPLQLADGSGTRYTVGSQVGSVSVNVNLPSGVTCDNCVIQWKYHVANSYGQDANGHGCKGCGPQEEFYGCSDVAIYAPGTNPKPNLTRCPQQNPGQVTAAPVQTTRPPVYPTFQPVTFPPYTNAPPQTTRAPVYPTFQPVSFPPQTTRAPVNPGNRPPGFQPISPPTGTQTLPPVTNPPVPNKPIVTIPPVTQAPATYYCYSVPPYNTPTLDQWCSQHCLAAGGCSPDLCKCTTVPITPRPTPLRPVTFPVTYPPPVTAKPVTYRPAVTNPPVTNPPVTYRPFTLGPVITRPPVTWKPVVTNAPIPAVTNPPFTYPPVVTQRPTTPTYYPIVTQGPIPTRPGPTNSPTTKAPVVTNPPTTAPPVTFRPVVTFPPVVTLPPVTNPTYRPIVTQQPVAPTYQCYSVPPYSSTALDQWCNNKCLSIGGTCPPELCKCNILSGTPRPYLPFATGAPQNTPRPTSSPLVTISSAPLTNAPVVYTRPPPPSAAPSSTPKPFVPYRPATTQPPQTIKPTVFQLGGSTTTAAKTSTSQPTAQPPSGNTQYCYSLPPYGPSANLDQWCDTQCKRVGGSCPANLCKCTKVALPRTNAPVRNTNSPSVTAALTTPAPATTTTPTTTTTASTTPQRARPYCYAVTPGNAQLDQWCDVSCKSVGGTCPPEFCQCVF